MTILNTEIENAITSELNRLGSPGTWWTAQERLAIAREVRRARGIESDEGNETSFLSDEAIEATRKITNEAHTVDKAWIDSCHERDLGPFPLVEVLAVVSKLVAIDTCLEGIGEPLRPLPEARQGEPSREVADGVKNNRGWLPTKGPASAGVCFSAVPAEAQAWHQLHSALYLDLDEMRDTDLEKELHRSQLELLAARTSYYNDCFY